MAGTLAAAFGQIAGGRTVGQILQGENPQGGAAQGPTPEGPTPEGPTPEGPTPEGPTSQGEAQSGAGHGLETGITCAGRTDKGVHALAQVVHVDLDDGSFRRLLADAGHGRELPGLARALTGIAGPGLVVWRATVAHPGFDARRSATGRRYRYDVEIAPRADPMRRGYRWHVGADLDLALLRLATDPIVGEHDFAAFCRRPPDQPSGPITRKVVDAQWRACGEGVLRFEIEAGSFCHQMVRSLVGALVAAGQGRIRPSDIVALLRRATRQGAPTIAPPHGLCLVAVRYPDELGGDWS